MHFFISQAPIYHGFSFNSRFLYELKRKVRLSKSMPGILHLWFRFVLIKGTAQSKIRSLRKNDSSIPKNALQKANDHTCDYVTLLICLRWSVVYPNGRKCSLSLNFLFTAHKESVIKQQRRSAVQLFCNTDTPLAWLSLT